MIVYACSFVFGNTQTSPFLPDALAPLSESSFLCCGRVQHPYFVATDIKQLIVYFRTYMSTCAVYYMSYLHIFLHLTVLRASKTFLMVLCVLNKIFRIVRYVLRLSEGRLARPFHHVLSAAPTSRKYNQSIHYILVGTASVDNQTGSLTI